MISSTGKLIEQRSTGMVWSGATVTDRVEQIGKLISAFQLDKNKKNERVRTPEVFERLRVFTGGYVRKHSSQGTSIAESLEEIVSINIVKIWYEFSQMPTFLEMDSDPHSFRIGDVIRVRIQIRDPPLLSYPIDVLPFYSADKNDQLELEAEIMSMNLVYKGVGQMTNVHVVLPQYLIAGNVAVIRKHGLFKRALIIKPPEPEDIIRRVKCYLVDEGFEILVHVTRVFRAVKDFWKRPPRIMNFRLAGLRRYENVKEYCQLLVEEIISNSLFEMSAKIVSKKEGGDKIILTSTKYPDRSINEIILRGMFQTFNMTSILETTNFYPSVQLASVKNNGDIMLRLNTPVLHHLHEILSNIKDNRVEIAQKKTGGLIQESESYIYKDDELCRCFRVTSSQTNTALSDEVRVLFVDYGVPRKVSKWKLSHVKYFGSRKLQCNLLSIIPAQTVECHLAGIASVNRRELYELFNNQNNMFSLRKVENSTEESSNATIPHVELLADTLETIKSGQSQSLNDRIIQTGAGTQIQPTKVIGPICYCCDKLSSVPVVETEGANWGRPGGRFVPLELLEILDIVILGYAKPGEFFVRSAYAQNEAMLYQIHLKCQSYLAENYFRDDQWCGCILDGHYFVVQAKFENTYFSRVCVMGTSLPQIGRSGDDEGSVESVEKMSKKVDCLFIDRAELRSVPVSDLRTMDPSVAVIPALGALAIWSCNGFKWDLEDWKSFMKFALLRRFKAKVLTVNRDVFGRLRFDMNLYEIGEKNSTGYLLRPKDRFWVWEPEKNSSKHKILK